MAQYFFTTRYRVGMGISFSCQLSEKEVMRYNDYMVGSATYRLVRLSRYYFSHGILQGCRGDAVKVASFAKAICTFSKFPINATTLPCKCLD